MGKQLTPNTAAALALRYAAFIRAVDGLIDNNVTDDMGDTARDLKEIQNITGVVVMKDAIIDLWVDYAAGIARRREIELREEGFTFHD